MNPNYFAGIQVYESPFALKIRKIPIDKSWIQRVIEWNPCNPKEPDYREVQEPAAYQAGDKFICHPSIIAELRTVTG